MHKLGQVILSLGVAKLLAVDCPVVGCGLQGTGCDSRRCHACSSGEPLRSLKIVSASYIELWRGTA